MAVVEITLLTSDESLPGLGGTSFTLTYYLSCFPRRHFEHLSLVISPFSIGGAFKLTFFISNLTMGDLSLSLLLGVEIG